MVESHDNDIPNNFDESLEHSSSCFNGNDTGENGISNEWAKASAETSESEEDREFEPTIGMMVHDFDDETTMIDEEQSEGGYEAELEDLKKNGEIPIEELRALLDRQREEYEKEAGITDAASNSNATTEKLYKRRNARHFRQNGLRVETDHTKPSVKTILRSKRLAGRQAVSYGANSDSDDFDRSNCKDVHVGDGYQAQVPRECYIQHPYDFKKEFIDQEHHVWHPMFASSANVKKYFRQLAKIPLYAEQPYEDLALNHFLKNDCDIERALSNVDCLIKEIEKAHTKWSIKDCELFEQGILIHGKNFWTIQRELLPHKSPNELVDFYYKWKKSERVENCLFKLKEKSKHRRQHTSVFDYISEVLIDRKLPYKISDDGSHYEINDSAGT